MAISKVTSKSLFNNKANNAITEFNTTVSANVTITTGMNAMSVGPVTIATGRSVTVPTGQRWVVL